MLIAALATALAVAGAARAHGDPSTHALEGDSLYPAVSTRPSQQVELRLIGVLRAAAQRGYPIKVALVGSGDDLADPSLLRKPQAFAEFVERELGGARMLDAPLVVVTPYGIGLAGRDRRGGGLKSVGDDDAQLAARGLAVSRHAGGNELAAVATTLVRRLARAAGRPLPQHVPSASAVWTQGHGGDGGLPHVPRAVLLGLGAFLACWVVFEVGARSSRRRAAPSVGAEGAGKPARVVGVPLVEEPVGTLAPDEDRARQNGRERPPLDEQRGRPHLELVRKRDRGQ